MANKNNASWARKILQSRVTYGDFTPIQTEAPKNALPGQGALYGTIGGTVGAATSKATLPTYGEFMAQKNAENAANTFASGVGGATKYAMGATYADGAQYAPSTTEGTEGGQTRNIKPGSAAAQLATSYAENMPKTKTTEDIIEAQRAAKYADAEAIRERATIDAASAYAQNRATYGTQAETLASMGLTKSGYGDYVEAQAYAQQRADIQAAKAGEAAAKREADRAYYADMLAQRENAKTAYGTLFDAAKGGTYTGDEILEIAKKYGITDDAELTTLVNAADNAKGKAETEKASAAYLTLLDVAKGGTYTADEIREAARKSGITDESDIEALAKTVENARAETEKANIAANITADTTDAEIAASYAGSEQAAKEARTKEAENAVASYVNAKDWAAADDAVEKYYKNGAFTADGRQSYYMQKAATEIEEGAKGGTLTASDAKAREQELEKMKNEGKISSTDFEAAKKYLYANIVTVMDGTNVKITPVRSTYSKHDLTSFDIEINGETIKLASHSRDPVDAKTRNALAAVAGQNPKNGTLALYDDGIYIYSTHGYNAWYKVSRNWTQEGTISSLANKRLYEIMRDDIAPTQAAPEKPKHTT